MGALADHKQAALTAVLGKTGSLADLEAAFWAGILDGSVVVGKTELDRVEAVSNFVTTNVAGDGTGLIVNFLSPGVAFILEAWFVFQHTVASARATAMIRDLGGTEAGRAPIQANVSPNTNQFGYVRTEVPGTYALPALGTPCSFELRFAVVTAGTLTIVSPNVSQRMTLRAERVG